MFGKAECMSAEERKSCVCIAPDGYGCNEVEEYLSHVSCGDGVSFAGDIDYWAEIPKWNH